MKDLAAELGVSAMTVSKALRNEGRISPTTRARICQHAAERGYRLNLAARTLVNGRSSLIGLILPDLVHPFFASLAKDLARSLRASGYSVALSSTEEDWQIEKGELNAYLSHGTDAIILATSMVGDGSKYLERLAAEVPLLLIDRAIDGASIPFVGSDDHAAGILATGHLIDRGYCRIAHIRGGSTSTAKLRLQGYRNALEKAGRCIDSSLVVSADSSDAEGEASGYRAMQILLGLEQRPDAIFCYNDIVAYGAMRAILEAGLKVPHDVALVGVSNMASLSFWDNAPIPLTTIDQNVGELARVISARILALVDGSVRQVEAQRIPVTLILRAST